MTQEKMHEVVFVHPQRRASHIKDEFPNIWVKGTLQFRIRNVNHFYGLKSFPKIMLFQLSAMGIIYALLASSSFPERKVRSIATHTATQRHFDFAPDIFYFAANRDSCFAIVDYVIVEFYTLLCFEFVVKSSFQVYSALLLSV